MVHNWHGMGRLTIQDGEIWHPGADRALLKVLTWKMGGVMWYWSSFEILNLPNEVVVHGQRWILMTSGRKVVVLHERACFRAVDLIEGIYPELWGKISKERWLGGWLTAWWECFIVKASEEMCYCTMRLCRVTPLVWVFRATFFEGRVWFARFYQFWSFFHSWIWSDLQQVLSVHTIFIS